MNITLNSVDLSTYGLVTKNVSGVHDLVGQERSRVWIPGQDRPSDIVLRRSLGMMKFGECVIASETSHADLIDKLKVLKGYTSPALGFVPFTITDRPNLRTFAHSLGFSIGFDEIPYLAQAVRFDWSLERYPYFEDVTAKTATDPASITNNGQLPTYPTYTCTAGEALGSGLSFTVNGKTWTYTGALVLNDVLVVTTDDPPDVTKNGTRDFANTSSTSEYPELVTGTNAVSKSAGTWTLGVSYRERFE